MYALLKLNAFIAPLDPGEVQLYPPLTTATAIKTADWVYNNALAHDYYLSYVNITCALFQMLDKLTTT
jgi:hypothetical protein